MISQFLVCNSALFMRNSFGGKKHLKCICRNVKEIKNRRQMKSECARDNDFIVEPLMLGTKRPKDSQLLSSFGSLIFFPMRPLQLGSLNLSFLFSLHYNRGVSNKLKV